MTRSNSRPVMESIESRQLMSGGPFQTVTLDGTILKVEGSFYEDIIQVQGDSSQIAVTGDPLHQVFNASAVTRVVIHGNEGNDRISVQGTVTELIEIYGDSGNDNIWGGLRNDTLEGGAGNDAIEGWSGNDRIKGDAGNDVLYGQSGHDTIFGGAGNDKMYGGTGNDYIAGEAGADSMYGGSGNDLLFAKNDGSRDLVDGGIGFDQAWVDKGLVLTSKVATFSTARTASAALVFNPSPWFLGDSVVNCERVF